MALVPVGVIAGPGVVSGTADGGTVTGGEASDAISAGQEIRSLDVNNPTEIAFIGEQQRTQVYRNTFVAQTLIYSKILVKERRLGARGPAVLNNSSELSNQEIIVWIKNGSVQHNGNRLKAG